MSAPDPEPETMIYERTFERMGPDGSLDIAFSAHVQDGMVIIRGRILNGERRLTYMIPLEVVQWVASIWTP